MPLLSLIRQMRQTLSIRARQFRLIRIPVFPAFIGMSSKYNLQKLTFCQQNMDYPLFSWTCFLPFGHFPPFCSFIHSQSLAGHISFSGHHSTFLPLSTIFQYTKRNSFGWERVSSLHGEPVALVLFPLDQRSVVVLELDTASVRN